MTAPPHNPVPFKCRWLVPSPQWQAGSACGRCSTDHGYMPMRYMPTRCTRYTPIRHMRRVVACFVHMRGGSALLGASFVVMHQVGRSMRMVQHRKHSSRSGQVACQLRNLCLSEGRLQLSLRSTSAVLQKRWIFSQGVMQKCLLLPRI